MRNWRLKAFKRNCQVDRIKIQQFFTVFDWATMCFRIEFAFTNPFIFILNVIWSFFFNVICAFSIFLVNIYLKMMRRRKRFALSVLSSYFVRMCASDCALLSCFVFYIKPSVSEASCSATHTHTHTNPSKFILKKLHRRKTQVDEIELVWAKTH